MSDIDSGSWKTVLLAAVVTGVAVVCANYIFANGYPSLKYIWPKKKKISDLLEEFQEAIATPSNLLNQVAEAMIAEMKAGLVPDSKSQLAMLTSYVGKLPKGTERGVFYALDLGGTNFRVWRVKLGGLEGRILEQVSDEVSIPESAKHGTTEELFDFIASKLAAFVLKNGANDFKAGSADDRQLGFTFSFPVEQTAINHGTMMKWTKGFEVTGTEGRDIVEVLEEALTRQNLKMRVNALINDTVGTLVGAHYWDQDAKVAVILGTGTNACYIEKMSEIKKWTGPDPDSDTMVINMEWGNFDSEILPKTFADIALDRQSSNAGEQCYEKLISGLYLGEIVRRVLLFFAQEDDLFNEEVQKKLSKPDSFPTRIVSAIDADSSTDLEFVDQVLRHDFGIEKPTLLQRKIVHFVCEAIARRGARLAAAGIVAVLRCIGADASDTIHDVLDKHAHLQRFKTKVAVDGGLYEKYPKFRRHMHDAVDQLLGPLATGLITIELSKDGSGIGAALVAASNSDQ